MDHGANYWGAQYGSVTAGRISMIHVFLPILAIIMLKLRIVSIKQIYPIQIVNFAWGEWLSASLHQQLAGSKPSWRLDIIDSGQLTPHHSPSAGKVCSCKFLVISQGLVQERNVKSPLSPGVWASGMQLTSAFCPGVCFSKAPIINRPLKAVVVYMQDRSFNSFASNLIKPSVNETKIMEYFASQDLISGLKSYRDFGETGPYTRLFKAGLG